VTKETWVDYKAVKAAVTIDMVLQRYGVLDDFKRQGDRLTGTCPVHKGTNARQFSADLKKGAWKCFSGQCGKGGNVIDLVAAIEQIEFREAAAKLQEWFGIKPEKPTDRPDGKPQTNRAAKTDATKPAVEPSKGSPKTEPSDDKQPNKPLPSVPCGKGTDARDSGTLRPRVLGSRQHERPRSGTSPQPRR
jgi:DNA primase